MVVQPSSHLEGLDCQKASVAAMIYVMGSYNIVHPMEFLVDTGCISTMDVVGTTRDIRGLAIVLLE